MWSQDRARSREAYEEITGIEYVQVPLHSRGRRMTDGANEIKDIELRDGQIEARNGDGVK